MGPPGAARHWCGNPSRSRSSLCLLLLCWGNRCTQTESSCEQGAGRGLKGEPRVQTSEAPGGREQDSPQVPRSLGHPSVQPRTPAFAGFFPGPRKREPKMVRLNRPPRAGFEASWRAHGSESFLLKGKLNHAVWGDRCSPSPKSPAG